MEARDEQLILSVVDRDPELKRLHEEHLQLERQLAQLNHKGFLNAEEEVERKRLQKVKLAGKDRMMEILSRYR
ncbi:MAG: DUF465 domain-containing protein [Deltaproteobacteria bacterium]|nr:MAG: DUF465 domain-containing protein [Deltaproteobacteria bacterium]